jgi:hypothetical protein
MYWLTVYFRQNGGGKERGDGSLPPANFWLVSGRNMIVSYSDVSAAATEDPNTEHQDCCCTEHRRCAPPGHGEGSTFGEVADQQRPDGSANVGAGVGNSGCDRWCVWISPNDEECHETRPSPSRSEPEHRANNEPLASTGSQNSQSECTYDEKTSDAQQAGVLTFIYQPPCYEAGDQGDGTAPGQQCSGRTLTNSDFYGVGDEERGECIGGESGSMGWYHQVDDVDLLLC